MPEIKSIGPSGQNESWPHRVINRILAIWPSRAAVLFIMAASVISGIATYAVMTRTPEATSTVFWLINLDLGLFLILAALVAGQITRLWAERKKGLAGSQLHVRLVFIFGLLAAAPAILMTLFSAAFFYFGVQAWFSDRVSTAVQESLVVAEAYLNEHQQVMRADVLAMANDLDREAAILTDNSDAMSSFVQTQSQLRNLSEVLVFTSSGRVLARSRLAFTLEFDPIPQKLMDRARSGEVVLLVSDQADAQDRVRALVKLDQYVDTFLLVGRLVDSKVINHLTHARDAVAGYTELEGRRSSFQLSITFMFVAVALLLLLVAVWFGLVFAGQLARPISQLITAAERVRSGDLGARVDYTDQDDELGQLGRSFNRMTSQLAGQREELMQANRLIDERRRFMEAVLASTSSGIVGLDSDRKIKLANPAAAELFGVDVDELVGQKIDTVFPEVVEILNKSKSKSNGKARTYELEYQSAEGGKYIFSLRITAEDGDKSNGQVLTFDDVTPLVAAQRKAAWSDVARRIAHEIKNPLTPIQLSAERLNRKYLPQIKDDPESFTKCTETIIRQVTQIGRMVNEFSDFARLPEAMKAEQNVAEIGQEAVTLQKQAYPNIRFDFKPSDKKIMAQCDAGQISQVLTNLLQNAVDAISENQEKGQISLHIEQENNDILMVIEDNGPGLPQDAMAHLTEPYVSTRKKGTGLGLAIVKKILDDHNGSIALENKSTGHGARITIRFEK
ncbi:MAG: ATP-binding protein [Pseudomonadota bacterium]